MPNYFNPNILLQDTTPDMLGKGLAGVNAGMNIRDRMTQRDMLAEQRQQGLAGRQALSEGVGMMEGLDPGLQKVLSENPDMAKAYFTQMISQKLKVKNALPDNEWIDDPTDGNYQIYVEKVTDPETRMPVMRPVPGMRKLKSYVDRLEQQKKEFEVTSGQKDTEIARREEEFKYDKLIGNKKLQVEYAKLKNENMKAKLQQAAQEFRFKQAQADTEVNYDNVKMKADAAIDAIDRMIGNKERGIPRHEGFEESVGRKGAALLWGLKDEPLDATDAAAFKSVYDRVTGQAFMTAFETLKGGGQITEMEGSKATASLLEMNVATDEKTFVKAAKDFQKWIKLGLAKAAKEKKLKSVNPGQTGGMIQVNSRQDIVNLFQKKYGRKPTLKETDLMMRNAGLK